MPKQSLRKRLQSFLQDRWFKLKLLVRFHWPALLLIILIVSIAAYWSRFLLPRADYQSAQLTMSTEVQSLAALLGIMLVGVTILWSQATGEAARLMELQPKYYELLRGSDRAHKTPPAIERLRLDYLKKIKGHSLPRQVFPYKHPKYAQHRDLFLDICRLSDLVHEYCGLGKILDTIERDLKELGFTETEITDRVVVRWYDLKSSSLEFLELVTDIFHPGNNTLDLTKLIIC